MVLNLATVVGAVTPVIVSTFFSHIGSNKSRAEKPVSSLTYEEGLVTIRKFLEFASKNTIEDLQRFSSQWIPHPPSVKVDIVSIPDEFLISAAKSLEIQLGEDGLKEIGGKTWWKWRRLQDKKNAEWIEIRDQYKERIKNINYGDRVMFYVHGGAYFFGSIGMHRSQMQVYARKLKARVFAPSYRLAPQFPFPCGLQDCLAAYMYLITLQDPTTIILAGDSAGGGMILSMMIILRDQNLPLPAGAILISPWVDLTHSFPSVLDENLLDYIPKGGFFHKPSKSWPPPPMDDSEINEEDSYNDFPKNSISSLHLIEGDPLHGFFVKSKSVNNKTENVRQNSDVPSVTETKKPKVNLTVQIEGQRIKLVEQIQIYAPNWLLPHPLVSPVFQPSLGGLPPLFILSGGDEPLRDEQMYLAHKAANPSKYAPGSHLLSESDKEKISQWKPTYVQYQVWDDMCHVVPILSFTSPVKHVYRSIAQFGYRAYDRAKIVKSKYKNEGNNISINTMLNTEEFPQELIQTMSCSTTQSQNFATEHKVGDILPPYRNYMIRQRVNYRGIYCNLAPESELAVCNMNPSDLGVVKAGPVLKWMQEKQKWDKKYAVLRRQILGQLEKELSKGRKIYPDDENPPPSALIRRIRVEDANFDKNMEV